MTTVQGTLSRSLIGGSWTDGHGEMMHVRSGWSGTPITDIATCTEADVRHAVQVAEAAQPAWAALALVDRVEILRELNRVIAANTEEIAQMITLETGKTISETREEILEYSAPAYQKAAEEALRHRGLSLPSTQERSNNKRLVLTHRPVGVVAVISPYNFPTDIASIGIAHALAVGNTVVWKPSEWTPVSCAMVAALFAEAGVPDGVLNLIQGKGETGAALVRDPGVDAIFFTGSTATGERIAREAGLKKTLLELGGDGPQIVLADADVEAAVDGAMLGCFYLAGQVCTSAERILVHESVHDEFVSLLSARMATLRVGDPTDEATEMGPLCNEGTLARVRAHVQDARDRGAEVRQFGEEDGLFYPPTLLVGVTPDMEIARAETFGPVAPVIKVASTEEAVAIANSSELGLTASVYTRDLATAWRVGEALQHGTVNINESTNYWDQLAPFGGTGKSGNARELSQWFFGTFTETKLLNFDLNDQPRGDRRVMRQA
ncbi:aldehyde dehydrogenase [Conexibacter sp. S30A1]|uniref:aldehyde dehydrogenase family protein n=1 Tax=Conexibacter sp. S30A1 TaxID=2937800 RepID=UPI0021118498|nr:aldehyde dehydrogenase family protein [Conexibacter sp. S30A1]